MYMNVYSMYNVQNFRPHLQSSSVERRQLKSTNKRCRVSVATVPINKSNVKGVRVE